MLSPTKLAYVADHPQLSEAASHPSAEQLQAFALGQLEPFGAMQLSNHLLAGCSVCERVILDGSSDHHRATPASSSRELREWALQVARHPASQVALILANSQPFPPVEIALALEELAESPQSAVGAPPPLTLLTLGFEMLVGAGVPQSTSQQVEPSRYCGDDSTGIERSVDSSDSQVSHVNATIKLGNRLCRELLIEGRVREAIEVLHRLTDSQHHQELSRSSRAALLMTTANVLRATQGLASADRSDVLSESAAERFPTTDRRIALVEAQQLLAVEPDHYLYSSCALQLAETLLFDSANQEPTAAELATLITNLDLHTRRLEFLGHDDLALVARHYLVTAFRRVHRWGEALDACQTVANLYRQRGDQINRLTLVLERARILEDAAQVVRAEQRYQEARRGLLLAGRPMLATIATVELARLSLKNDLALDWLGLANELSMVFATGRFDRSTLASLLLLRESCIEGTVTVEETQRCHRLLLACKG